MKLQEQRPLEYELYGYKLISAESNDELGTLYKATDLSNDKTVAVQVFSRLVEKDPALIEALELYAYEIKPLVHTNIQQVLDYETGDSGCILVKEYAAGERLDDYLQRVGTLEWPHAIRFIKHLLRGLVAAHEAGFIHQSLAPNNIYLARGNTLKISNIGLYQIVKSHDFLSESEWKNSMERKYVAPEILTDEFRTANEASDVYSIGLIAYQMLTGIRPGDDENLSYFVDEHISAQRLMPAHHINENIPEHLSEIVQKATEHHAIHRFSTAEDMLDALEEMGIEEKQPRFVDRCRGLCSPTRGRAHRQT